VCRSHSATSPGVTWSSPAPANAVSGTGSRASGGAVRQERDQLGHVSRRGL
jgi:hypothetical protein